MQTAKKKPRVDVSKMGVRDLVTHACLGDVVLFYDGCDETATPAVGLVVGKGPGTGVALNLFDQYTVGRVPVEGVRHLDDPTAREADRSQGGWRHPDTRLAARVSDMDLGRLRWALDVNGNPFLQAVVEQESPHHPAVVTQDPEVN